MSASFTSQYCVCIILGTVNKLLGGLCAENIILAFVSVCISKGKQKMCRMKWKLLFKS